MTLLPNFFVYGELRAGTLVSMDVGLEAEGAELYIAYQRDRTTSAKVVVLTESLGTSFGDPVLGSIVQTPYLIRCISSLATQHI